LAALAMCYENECGPIPEGVMFHAGNCLLGLLILGDSRGSKQTLTQTVTKGIARALLCA